MKCSIERCQKDKYCKGYCKTHYNRLHKHGDVYYQPQCRREGQTKDPLYITWSGMVSRCYIKSNRCYEKYGAKGVRVCERWLGSDGFFNFKRDMGEKPSAEYTLDRINPSKDYCPENCRWASIHLQAVNKRKVAKFRGVSKHQQGGFNAKIQSDNAVFRKHFKTFDEAVAWRKAMELSLGINADYYPQKS